MNYVRMGFLLIAIMVCAGTFAADVTIGFMGDVMVGRAVNQLLVQSKNYNKIWGNLLPLLKSTDFNIANLETTFSKNGIKVPKAFNFQSDPANVETLLAANIKIVNTANNHILDYGVKGLKETIKTLDNAYIKHVGVGLTLKQSQYPVYLSKKGLNIAVLGFTDNEPGWAAQAHKAGINYISIDPKKIETIKSLLESTKKKVDFLIVSLHWGGNWEERPSRDFQKFAHLLLDNGVDLVHGHSAHIFQGIEIYKNKLIMYSTGDFIDDYAVDLIAKNNQSFFFLVTIDAKGLKELRLIPTTITNMQVNEASTADGRASLRAIKDLSEELGTFIPANGIWHRMEE